MKNLITAIAGVIILLIFVLQFGTSQVTHKKITQLEKDVSSFTEVVKQKGCVDNEIVDELKINIANNVKCNANEIIVTGPTTVKNRGEVIKITVSVPINDVIASASFWGISKQQNKAIYFIQNNVTSEFIPR